MINENNFVYDNLKNHEMNMVYPTQYGWHRYVNKGNTNSTLKQNYVLHIVLNGHGIYKVKGKIFNLKPKQAFIVKPSEIVYYYPDAEYNDGFEYIWIGFEGDGAENIVRNLRLDGFYSYILNLKSVDNLKSYVFDMINHRGKNTIFYIAKLYQLFDEVINNTIVDDQHQSNEKSHNNKMVNYIHNNIRTVTVNSLCETFSMERSGLYKYFQREFKMSPQEYIIQNKLEIARELIVETNIDLKGACNNSGFGDYSHFCRMFVKRFGSSPGEYRRLNSIKEEQLDD